MEGIRFRSGRGTAWLATLGGIAALALACGGEEAPGPSGQAMGGAPSTSAATDAHTEPGGPNSPPVIEKVELRPPNPVPGDRIDTAVTAHDPDGDKIELVYSWKVNGRTVPGNRPDHRVGNVDRGTQIELTVVARDGQGASPPFQKTVKVGNQPPKIVAVAIEPDGPITAAHDVGLRPQALDPDGDALSYRVAWRVNGQPASDEPVLSKDKFKRGDSISFTVVALDGSAESREFRGNSIKVENAAPRIESYPKGLDADGALHYKVEAVDADGDPRLRYRLVRGPKGMEMENFEGMLTWQPTPDQAGTHPVEIEVDDLRGGTGRQKFDLEVTFGAPPAAPKH